MRPRIDVCMTTHIYSSEPESENSKIRVIVNTNAKMSRGKLAAHVAHAVLTAAGVHPDVPIVVLGGKPRDIEQMSTFIRDNGKTELEPGTITAGTDYVFESATNRRRAISELMQVVSTTDDPTAASRVSAAIALLRG